MRLDDVCDDERSDEVVLGSTCLVFGWNIEFLDIFIADSLSINKLVSDLWVSPRSCIVLHSHTISHAASQVDMYFASIEEMTIVVFFLQFQDIFDEPIFIK